MADHEDFRSFGARGAGGAVTRSHPDLVVGSWNVDRIGSIDGSLEPPLQGSRVQVRFDGAGAVMGHAGCNSYRGPCRIEGDAIDVGTLATTRKFCLRPPGVMDQEARYLELLAQANRIAFEADNTLVLFDDSDARLLMMKRVAGWRDGEGL